MHQFNRLDAPHPARAAARARTQTPGLLTRRQLLAAAVSFVSTTIITSCGRNPSPAARTAASAVADPGTPETNPDVVTASSDSAGRWRDVTPPPDIPWTHTATLLPSGRVLVSGASTYLYDPPSDRWQAVPSSSPTPVGHTASLLANGTVLLAGGSIGRGVTDTAWLFDPASQSWRPTTSLHAMRMRHLAVTLTDNQVLVVGGDPHNEAGRDVVSAERFDPSTETWLAAGTIETAPSTITRLPDGAVVVTGIAVGSATGSSEPEPHLRLEHYDPTANQWSRLSALPTGRTGHSVTLLEDGQILIAGGAPLDRNGANLPPLATTARYDPRIDQWHPAAPLRVARTGHTATRLADGRVLVIGGSADPQLQFRVEAPSGSGSFTIRGTANIAEIYDPATDRWQDAGTTHPAGPEHTATLLPDGEVLLVGSNRITPDSQPVPALAERYSPSGSAIASHP